MEEHLACLWSFFKGGLFKMPSENGTHPLFNPYLDCEPALDLPAAAQIRRENLQNYFSSFTGLPPVLVIGEAPGWKGCRFSGIPFTSEAQLVANQLPFSGQSSNNSGKVFREASATIFWEAMLAYHPNFLAWNCLPLHPSLAGRPASNRHVTQGEAQRFDVVLRSLIEILMPQVILAVGKAAGRALDRLAVTHSEIRHPSHGGAGAFRDGISKFFGKLELNPP